MTANEIFDFVGERGEAINRADLARLNEMLFELPLEDVSEVRAWALEAIRLKVTAPEYEGDIELSDNEV